MTMVKSTSLPHIGLSCKTSAVTLLFFGPAYRQFERHPALWQGSVLNLVTGLYGRGSSLRLSLNPAAHFFNTVKGGASTLNVCVFFWEKDNTKLPSEKSILP